MTDLKYNCDNQVWLECTFTIIEINNFTAILKIKEISNWFSYLLINNYKLILNSIHLTFNLLLLIIIFYQVYEYT